ncbi:MAG: hypothetical protein Q9227_009172 [Pyrenula ochraceoflavens]
MPSAVTLPYTYKAVPSSLPQSATVEPAGSEKPKYVVSSSGHAAHPDDIMASCKSLQEHIARTKTEASEKIQAWERGIKERELAEKRRVAPGWLDREEKILQPTRTEAKGDENPDLMDSAAGTINTSTLSPSREGEELDRAFGGLQMR